MFFGKEGFGLRTELRQSRNSARLRPEKYFCPAHVRAKNRFYFLSPPAGSETLRGFFDKLRRPGNEFPDAFLFYDFGWPSQHGTARPAKILSHGERTRALFRSSKGPIAYAPPATAQR